MGGCVRWKMGPDASEETTAGPRDPVLSDASAQKASSRTPVLAPHSPYSLIAAS